MSEGRDRVQKADHERALRLPAVDPKLFRPDGVQRVSSEAVSPEALSAQALSSPDIVIDLTGDETAEPHIELLSTPGTETVVDLDDGSSDTVIDLTVNGSVHASQWPTTPVPTRAPEPEAIPKLKIHSRRARAIKRILDVAIAVPLLMLALPVIGACMLMISITSPGPALFRQERIGRDRKSFNIMKLRTMRTDAEELLEKDPELAKKYVECGFKLPEGEDPRITRVGRFLRKTSLDELPQLVHVVSGEMSLVGPRPLVKPEVARLYGTDADLLLSVKPGITGQWQVNGRSGVSGTRRAALEKRYLRHWSVKRDVGIIVHTVPAVLSTTGAH